jgi:hypothetical protein
MANVNSGQPDCSQFHFMSDRMPLYSSLLPKKVSYSNNLYASFHMSTWQASLVKSDKDGATDGGSRF